MNVAAHVIGILGGTRKAANLTGERPSTVQSWKKAGHIPAWHQAKVLAAAKANDIKLSPEDMIGGTA